ncbi:hypothetical protein P3T40_004084 [Paraburkholderia sp. EB58]|jgi:hypothetical protein|uniref:DUF4148 domain-containing protein n=1 Tax=Paraburkholderia sp. EB58 TaxID=3035125 RepID=UPI003D1F4AA3
MKSLICLTLAISVLAGPVSAFAQTTSGPLTRAQVRAELVRLEQAGYSPSTGEDPNYPADIQAAEAKIAAQDSAQLAANAVGGVAQGGSSQTGLEVHANPNRSLYVGH